MTEIRIVPDPLVFPDYAGEYASEKYMAVTPGQVIHIVSGSGGNFTWTVPKGVTKVRVEVFGP